MGEKRSGEEGTERDDGTVARAKEELDFAVMEVAEGSKRHPLVTRPSLEMLRPCWKESVEAGKMVDASCAGS